MKKHLLNQITQNGAVPLSEFMEKSIQHYYAEREPFGVDGDFTTAPEISQMFGEMIGAWILDLWIQMGKPELDLIEFGPGRGTLMADILRVTSKLTNVNIYLADNSPSLVKTQKKVLSDYDVNWISALDEIKTKNPCVIIGNEFLDALPIEQLKRNDRGWQKRLVKNENESFAFDWAQADNEIKVHLPKATQSNEIYEVSPERLDAIKECEAHLTKTTGAALFVDYGYLKSHYGDTLQAVQNHQYTDILKTAGNSDLTAHVDFDALARALGLAKHLTTQRQFLINLGIEHRAAALSQKQDVSADLNRLISPDEMGDLFKVLCFYHGDNVKPAGF